MEGVGLTRARCGGGPCEVERGGGCLLDDEEADAPEALEEEVVVGPQRRGKRPCRKRASTSGVIWAPTTLRKLAICSAVAGTVVIGPTGCGVLAVIFWRAGPGVGDGWGQES